MAPCRRIAAFACALLVLLGGRTVAAQDIQYGPYLTVERDHFQVNGEAKFLYFVSLFDAVREAALSPARLDEDLDYIKNTLRADGIRVVPNWLVYKDDSILTPTYVGPATDTLFDPSNPGTLRASTLAALKLLLEHASSRKLIVDVSFTRETLPAPGMSSDQYQAALVIAARELKPYRNVLFDVQNEFTKNWPGASFDEKAAWMANLRRAVNAPDVDPFRIVVASVESTAAFDAGQFAAARGMGAVAFHDARNSSWYQQTTLTQIGADIRSGLGQTSLPIYLQEPTPWTSQDQAGNFTDAAKYAKEAGIAAWTFHQRAGFNLQNTSFKSRVSGTAVSNLKAELETVRWTVDSQTWGLDATDETDYYHLDPLGSVRAITDQNQAVKERHDYLPFGEEYGATGGVETRRFTGKERDSETGLDYFGARSYSAQSGRFASPDPSTELGTAAQDPQQWNRYTYVRNSPTVLVDPDGRNPAAVIVIVAGPEAWIAAGVAAAAWVIYSNREAIGHSILLARDASADFLSGWFDRLKSILDKEHQDAAARDLAGKPILGPSGKPYDHIGEVKNALTGLNNLIQDAYRELAKNQLSPEKQAQVEQILKEALKKRAEVEAALKEASK